MSTRVHRTSDGFTLTELLVAITILGIIVVAIGAMITTSFRTSTMVSAELQGSRGPKVVSRYWLPDVEQAESVTPGGSCSGGGNLVATIVSHVVTSAFDTPTDTGTGQPRTIEWRVVPAGRRIQMVRSDTMDAAHPLVVVSDLEGTPCVTVDRSRATITVTVPDRSRTDKTYTFGVTGMSQITAASAP